jgi:hypothetical protein
MYLAKAAAVLKDLFNPLAGIWRQARLILIW